MKFFLILVGIYLAIAFIYSKRTDISFGKACAKIIINIIIFIFKAFIDGARTSAEQAEREAKKRGMDDVYEKASREKAFYDQADKKADTAKEHVNRYFDD